MTHDDLIEKVARIVCCGGDDKCDRRWYNQGPCDILAEDRTSCNQARSILSLVADAMGAHADASAKAAWATWNDCAFDEAVRVALRASPLHPQGDSQQPKDDV